MFPAQMKRLSCRRFGIALSWRSTLVTMGPSDAFRVQVDHAVLANRSLPQPLVPSPMQCMLLSLTPYAGVVHLHSLPLSAFKA